MTDNLQNQHQHQEHRIEELSHRQQKIENQQAHLDAQVTHLTRTVESFVISTERGFSNLTTKIEAFSEKLVQSKTWDWRTIFIIISLASSFVIVWTNPLKQDIVAETRSRQENDTRIANDLETFKVFRDRELELNKENLDLKLENLEFKLTKQILEAQH